MRVYIHVGGFFDWEPIPKDVQPTPEEINGGRIRPAANGGYLMRVPKLAKTHVEVQIPEHHIIATIIHAYTDKGKQSTILTRHEAVAEHLATMVVPHHTNRKWMTKIEVHDDGPDEALFRSMIEPHLVADHGRAPGKNIDAEDVDELVKAYTTVLTPSDPQSDHVKHLHKHFKIKVPKVAPKEGTV